MRRHLKFRGLSLLALVGVMAVSASAAQANWQLLQSRKAVSSLKIEGSSSEGGELIVPGNGVEIHCSGSTGSATVTASGASLTGTATVAFGGCFELNFGEICETHTAGQPDGTVVTNGKGVGGMVSAEEVYLESEKASEEFANVLFTGAECPLSEIDGHTTGHVKITALTALNDEKSHVVHIEATGLNFFGDGAELVTDGMGTNVILGTINVGGPTFAVHLIGL